MKTNTLFTPLELGSVSLRNRIVMAPTTRMRAKMPGNIPWELSATYYRQRASAGLIITEATPVSQRGHGYFHTPGIHTTAQADGWALVTSAGCTERHFQQWAVARSARCVEKSSRASRTGNERDCWRH
jgi:N-ethylmaleimide reductase